MSHHPNPSMEDRVHRAPTWAYYDTKSKQCLFIFLRKPLLNRTVKGSKRYILLRSTHFVIPVGTIFNLVPFINSFALITSYLSSFSITFCPLSFPHAICRHCISLRPNESISYFILNVISTFVQCRLNKSTTLQQPLDNEVLL